MGQYAPEMFRDGANWAGPDLPTLIIGGQICPPPPLVTKIGKICPCFLVAEV